MLPVLVVKRTGGGNRLTRRRCATASSGHAKSAPFRWRIEKLVRRVETSVCQQPEEEVTTEQIGRMVMDGLKELDEVAYIRFASVYRQFRDVQSFMEELQLLLDSQKNRRNKPKAAASC